MVAMTVKQIAVTPLKRIGTQGGDVLHALKSGDPGFLDFGEVYFSQIKYGAIKAWKRHKSMTLNLVVPFGAVYFKFVDHEGGVSNEIIGLDRYVRLTIPPGIWFGFKGLTSPYSLVMNIADIPHNPNEVERKELNEIEASWEV